MRGRLDNEGAAQVDHSQTPDQERTGEARFATVDSMSLDKGDDLLNRRDVPIRRIDHDGRRFERQSTKGREVVVGVLDRCEQFLVSVGASCRGVLSDSLSRRSRIGTALHDTKLGEREQRSEIGLPNVILKRGFGHERDATFDEQPDHVEEDRQGPLREFISWLTWPPREIDMRSASAQPFSDHAEGA